MSCWSSEHSGLSEEEPAPWSAKDNHKLSTLFASIKSCGGLSECREAALELHSFAARACRAKEVLHNDLTRVEARMNEVAHTVNEREEEIVKVKEINEAKLERLKTKYLKAMEHLEFLEGAQREHDLLTEKYKSLEVDNASLKKRLSEVQEMLDTARDLNSRDPEISEHLKSDNHRLKKERNALTTQLEQARRDLEQTGCELERVNGELNTATIELERQRDDHQGELDVLNNQIQTLKNELNELKDTGNGLKEEATGLREEASGLRSSLNEYKRKLEDTTDELVKTKGELARTRDELAKLTVSYQDKASEVEGITKALQDSPGDGKMHVHIHQHDHQHIHNHDHKHFYNVKDKSSVEDLQKSPAVTVSMGGSNRVVKLSAVQNGKGQAA